MIEIADLFVRRGCRIALHIDRLSLFRGKVLAVIGPNGAGKSTLLLTMAGLLPYEGTLSFFGEPFRWGDLRIRRRIAMVLQEPLLLRGTVAENVQAGLKIRRIPGAERERRVNDWLERLGILALKDRPAKSLSGGEAQRVSLARALVLEPDLLLLDEPFASLDPPTRAALTGELRSILAARRTTAVFVTHDRGEALMLGDRIAVLGGGTLLQEGPPEVVFNTPATAEVAALVGVETVLPGAAVAHEGGLTLVRVQGAVIRAAGEFRLGPVWVCLRPEDVILHSGSLGAVTSLRNHLEGTVSALASLNGPFRATVDCGFPLVALISKQAYLELGLGLGQRIGLSFKAHAVHLIAR